jgi:hypothetical protein
MASSGAPAAVSGTVSDLTIQIQQLLDAPPGSSLIIEVSGLQDAFVQFTAGPETIQIDHPLITAEQIQREDALRKVLTSAGRSPYVSEGSDGAGFLDCDVPRDPAGIAILVQRILESLFGIDSSTELRFVGNGFTPVADDGLSGS